MYVQVYRGRLHSGEEVAVKVQRPFVLETVTVDLFLVRYLPACLPSCLLACLVTDSPTCWHACNLFLLVLSSRQHLINMAPLLLCQCHGSITGHFDLSPVEVTAPIKRIMRLQTFDSITCTQVETYCNGHGLKALRVAPCFVHTL